MGKSKEKKSKKTPEELSLTIKIMRDDPEHKTSPVIGYFPSGYDPLKYSKDPDSESDPSPSVKVFKRVNSQNPRNPRMQVVVGPSGSQVNFVGTNYSGEATTPQLCNYALGVLDKEAGVLKMVPIASNRIFRLEPKVGGIETVDEDDEDITKEERDGKPKPMSNMYSTKKNKRRDAKRDTLRQTEEPGMQDNNDFILPEIEINKDALGDVIYGKNARNIPPYDEDATSPEMAYPLDKIIARGEWVYLRDIFELVESGSELDPNTYPNFVCNRVHICEAIEDESKRERMAAILSYITHLIKYNDKQSMDGVSSARHHRIPGILTQKFSSLFGATKNERPPIEKQRLLIRYVLVLSLSFDGFRSDPTDIAKDLRTKVVSLKPIFEYLGCKFVREGKVYLATLPVPLKFNTMGRKRRGN